MKEQTKVFRQNPESMYGIRTKISNEGRLLLICDGNCQIIFAHGDHSVFYGKLQDLRHQKLFELGFTQRSLRRVAYEAEGGLLQVPRRSKKLVLELVKPFAKCNEDVFNRNKSIYLSQLEVTCSLVKVKFSRSPVIQRPCEIRRLPISLLDKETNTKMLTLVEITKIVNSHYSETSYEDYCLTLQKIKKSEKERMEEVELEIQRDEPRVKIEEVWHH